MKLQTCVYNFIDYSTEILENKSRITKGLDSPLPLRKTVEIFITQKELSMLQQEADQIKEV